MNSNLRRAVTVIHAVLGSVPPEQAAAVAHALDSAHLLVDPRRTPGTVLRRTPDGGWSQAGRPLTALEHKAMAWDTACARARGVARAVERHLAGHIGPTDVRVDGDRVRVVLRVDGPARWTRWRAYFGITIVGEGSRPHTVVGEGELDGVRVTVVAHGASARPPAPTMSRARLFRLGGVTYDLTLPLRDAQGDLWYFQGCRRQDGMPLMSVDGRPERCSLANVVAHLGPLTPVTAPVMAPVTDVPRREESDAGVPAAVPVPVPRPVRHPAGLPW
ncbi:BN159_2729 family protein [Streptomyces sp. NPDC090106]|uniref:BN159_2729 family protein n=1 Tax=Streptomyces sp. NPDC090106 TaxID=3365946 RepID=UPI00381DD1DA